jgi:tripartite-type tricarboxylate transporter receptor subunit TctC
MTPQHQAVAIKTSISNAKETTMKSSWKKYLVALAALVGFAGGAVAQEYPNRPVKILVGYVPGGGPDLVARILAQKLSQILGQQFLVENKPGASGTVATTLVSRVAPDGYTLLLGETGQLVLAPHILKSLPYDPVKDFTPIGMVGGGAGMGIVAGAKSSIKSLQDLMRESKANPGKIYYGSTGIGGIHHIAMESFKAASGLDVTHVPYKGGGQSIQALVSGEVPIIMTGLSTALPYLRTGQATLISVTSAARLDPKPNVPVLTEMYKDMDAFDSDTGILGPAGLPPEVVSKLSKALKQATESPDFVASMKKVGQSIVYSTPEAYSDLIRRNLKRYERAVKIANIEPE